MSKLQYYESELIAPGSYKIRNTFSDKLPLKVYCYLVVGEKYALLIDTMFGFGDLSLIARRLPASPLR